MRTREKSYLCRQRTDFLNLSAVNALLLVKQPTSYYRFLELIKRVLNILRIFLCGIFFLKMRVYIVIYNLEPVVSYRLVVGVKSLFNRLGRICLYILKYFLIYNYVVILKLGLAHLVLNLLNECAELFDFLMRKHNSVKHYVLRNLVRTRLNHYYLCHTARNRKV